MQYHTLNEHTFLQTCTGEDRVFKKTLGKLFFFCPNISEKEKILKQRKKLKKPLKKNNIGVISFLRRKQNEKRMLYIHIYFRVCTRARAKGQTSGNLKIYFCE